jgi:hypothetical protein
MPGSLSGVTHTGEGHEAPSQDMPGVRRRPLAPAGRHTRVVTSASDEDRRQHLGVILGVVAGVLLLALLAVVVIELASGPGTRSTTATPPSPPTVSSAPPAPSPLAPLTLVDYAGRDFITVRAELRALQLGVQLIFGSEGDSRAVDHTVPAAGTPIDRGITIKVYVVGAAPLLVPPDVVGHPCNEAGRELSAAGVYPQYPTGRSGVVAAQDPPGAAPGVHWNDRIRISCGSTASSEPVPSEPAASQPG